MQNIITLKQKEIAYTLKISKRAKRMRLAIYYDGSFVVTAPKSLDLGIIEKFIAQKSRWVINKLDYFKSFGESQKFKSRPATRLNSKTQFLAHKERAFQLAQDRIEYLNQFYGFKFKGLSIGNQKTRWGSCSRSGNLSFNYKIALLAQDQCDYIIAHELCHLAEFNHSKAFWLLVAKTVPNYAQIRKELNKNPIKFH